MLRRNAGDARQRSWDIGVSGIASAWRVSICRCTASGFCANAHNAASRGSSIKKRSCVLIDQCAHDGSTRGEKKSITLSSICAASFSAGVRRFVEQASTHAVGGALSIASTATCVATVVNEHNVFCVLASAAMAAFREIRTIRSACQQRHHSTRSASKNVLAVRMRTARTTACQTASLIFVEMTLFCMPLTHAGICPPARLNHSRAASEFCCASYSQLSRVIACA